MNRAQELPGPGLPHPSMSRGYPLWGGMADRVGDPPGPITPPVAFTAPMVPMEVIREIFFDVVMTGGDTPLPPHLHLHEVPPMGGMACWW